MRTIVLWPAGQVKQPAARIVQGSTGAVKPADWDTTDTLDRAKFGPNNYRTLTCAAPLPTSMLIEDWAMWALLRLSVQLT